MRVDRLRIQNFRCFEDQEFVFDPDFSVLIGKNGSGKTAALEALAVAIGSWLLGVPGHSSRGIQNDDIRRVPGFEGDQLTFEPTGEARIEAHGSQFGALYDEEICWARSRRPSGKTRTAEANPLRDYAAGAVAQVRSREPVVLPVLAYYGAGRLWQTSRLPREKQELSLEERSRLEGYRAAIDPRCNPRTLQRWMRLQAQIRLEEEVETNGMQLVRHAMTTMTEGAEDVDYRGRWKDIVAFFGGDDTQPFSRLSAGQRNMLALAGDLAMRIARLNPQLSYEALNETPGVVLIDEIDLHLHPSWQRHIVDDLRRTFPRVQFIATTHSPFIVQSLREGELIPLDAAPVPQTDNLSIEAIAKGLMRVEETGVAAHYREMVDVAKRYLMGLEQAPLDDEEKLEAFKQRLADQIEPYADNPAFQAFLEMERVAALGS